MSKKITLTFDFPTDPTIWHGWFTESVNRPTAWILSARDLLDQVRTSGDALRAAWIQYHGKESSPSSQPPRGQHRVYLFLAAFAVENLLKALVVEHANWLDSQIAQKIPDELKSHMLLDLAVAGAVDLTDDESEVLERLTEFGIWLGRYPAPTTLQHTKPKKLKSGIVNIAGHMYGSDMREVEAILNKLIDKLVGVDGAEYLVRYPNQTHQDFENYSISPNVRPW